MHKILVFFIFKVTMIVSLNCHEVHYQDYYSHPKYAFEYGVHDPHTHDSKKHWEIRNGDVVKGSYSLIQPDGRMRIVNYEADGKNGFNALVKFYGEAKHPNAHGSHINSAHVPSQKASIAAHLPHRINFPATHSSTLSSPIQGASGNHESVLSLGRPVAPAHEMNPVLDGYDTREPHGSTLIIGI